MIDLLIESVSLVNLPLTILTGLVFIYWVLVILGALDLDTFDFAGDDLSVDAEPATAGGGLFAALSRFFHLGETPTMVIVSILVVSMWTISMIMNHYFNNGSLLLGAIYLVPNFVVSLFITWCLAKPFRKMFKALNYDAEKHPPLMGQSCIVTTSEVNQNFGQAEVKTAGAPLLINVRTTGDTVLNKGETGLIIKEDNEKCIYTVIRVSDEKLER